MEINLVIDMLLKIKEQHGNIQVYFDCPECNKSFVPNRIVPIAKMSEIKT